MGIRLQNQTPCVTNHLVRLVGLLVVLLVVLLTGLLVVLLVGLEAALPVGALRSRLPPVGAFLCGVAAVVGGA